MPETVRLRLRRLRAADEPALVALDSDEEVMRYIGSRGASQVRTATFLDKPKARKVEFAADYVGFSIEPYFVIGYGLDYAEKYRNIPEIQVLSD